MRSQREEPDDFPATVSLSVVAFVVLLFKIVVGLASVPLAVLFWLHDLGSRTIEAVKQFVDPQP